MTAERQTAEANSYKCIYETHGIVIWPRQFNPGSKFEDHSYCKN